MRVLMSTCGAATVVLAACFPMMGSRSTPTGPGTDSAPLAAHEQPLVNREGERLLWEIAQEWAPTVGNPAPTILRAYVVGDHDWVIDRNENTGIITDRFVHAAIIYKGGESGKCRQWLCNFVEQENGGSWGRPALSCPNGLTVALTCESVQALRASPPR